MRAALATQKDLNQKAVDQDERRKRGKCLNGVRRGAERSELVLVGIFFKPRMDANL